MALAKLVSNAVSNPRSRWLQVLYATGLILLPPLFRWTIDGGRLGMHFATCFPAILVASLLLDLFLASLVAFGSAAVTQWLFVGEPWFKHPDQAHFSLFTVFALTSASIIVIGDRLKVAIRRADEYSRKQEQYNEELKARVQGVLAVIQALSVRGINEDSPLDFYSVFSERLNALGRASDLLQIGSSSDRKLPTMFQKAIAPFCSEGQIYLAGEPIEVPTDSCIPLIMAIHELCTNAMRYGALSVPEGRVSLRWFLRPDGKCLTVLWEERLGPCVKPPKKQGLGHKLLSAQPGLAAVDLNFPPSGAWCEISINCT
ncbi:MULTISPECIES: sensor histidine kinase [unclassified Novosphingobium]|uniref:sensor histidine kinase n=1 Tax=unclassified Novosphingobium TaxID=2644732 RepID=UPI00188133F9|nr:MULTISPECIES: HWE histidine kinase domain-containing protein [unclassified Novosphingobium]QOV96625.1 hypothetical protein IM701_21530 [Novosphingobium sp. ES2-1]